MRFVTVSIPMPSHSHWSVYRHLCTCMSACRIAYMSASPVVMATNKDTTSPAAPAAAHVIILSPTRGAFIRAACAQHTGLYPLRAGIC